MPSIAHIRPRARCKNLHIHVPSQIDDYLPGIYVWEPLQGDFPVQGGPARSQTKAAMTGYGGSSILGVPRQIAIQTSDLGTPIETSEDQCDAI